MKSLHMIQQCVRVTAVLLLCMQQAVTAPWIEPNWAGDEPVYPPGSLEWRTNHYSNAPVVYRTEFLLDPEKKLEIAAFEASTTGYLYAFVNGRKIASERNAERANVEFTHVLRPGANTLVISAPADGFALAGIAAYTDGSALRLDSAPDSWKVAKLPLLTLLEAHPLHEPGFDDSGWFDAQPGEGDALQRGDEELLPLLQDLAQQRLQEWDEIGLWRLRMLETKGYAVVDWVSHGFGGARRLPSWLLERASAWLSDSPETPGQTHRRVEALTRYAVLHDEALNFALHTRGLRMLGGDEDQIDDLHNAARGIQALLSEMKSAILDERLEAALDAARDAEAISDEIRREYVLNRLNRVMDNKFGWLDNTRIMNNSPEHWELRIASEASLFASPLSHAAHVQLHEPLFTIEGWEDHQPARGYDSPRRVGPVRLWAVLEEDRVSALTPSEDNSGVVYDRQRDGDLEANWVLLVPNLGAGGDLPIQLVFLHHPNRIEFVMREGDTAAVTVRFDRPDAELFMLRPIQEWRGLLEQRQRMAQTTPLNQNAIAPYREVCELWSRAVLRYPVNFAEAFVNDPDDPWVLRVANIYDYQEFSDEWGTESLTLAPLPPLATLGLMRNYDGLAPLSESVENVGSRGNYGDHLAIVDEDAIPYRVPMDRFKRFGGFTAFAFGDTDIGVPGSRTEVELIAQTGSNSYRPQHNQRDDRARRTAEWTWEADLQHMFNIDEKWIPDAVEHFHDLAEQYKDFPPDAIAFDLLNEPETRHPREYNTLIRKITNAIRAVNDTHLIYVETIPPWGPGARPFPQAAFETLEPTGDSRTIYSFHDYEYRLGRIEGMGAAGEAEGIARWPNDQADKRALLDRWLPAFEFAVRHGVAIHLGEFGAHEQVHHQDVYANPSAYTLTRDHLAIFEHGGWHWNYYSNRSTTRVRADGSVEDSYVQDAYRDYFGLGSFNLNRPDRWWDYHE